MHDTYILSQTSDGLVLVDMHAAHERLVYERLKKERGRASAQVMLVPDVVELAPDEVSRLLAASDDLAGFGLSIEAFGPGAVLVRETPAALGEFDIKASFAMWRMRWEIGARRFPWRKSSTGWPRPLPAIIRSAPGAASSPKK